MNPQSSTSETGGAVKVSPATAGSFVLVVSFFLPWISFLGQPVAGYEMHKIWGAGETLFLIPVLGLLSLCMGLGGRKNVIPAQIAGGLVLVFLAVALYQFGAELFEVLSIGAYLTLVSGIFLLSVAPRLHRAQSTAVPTEVPSARVADEPEINQ